MKLPKNTESQGARLLTSATKCLRHVVWALDFSEEARKCG